MILLLPSRFLPVRRRPGVCYRCPGPNGFAAYAGSPGLKPSRSKEAVLCGTVVVLGAIRGAAIVGEVVFRTHVG